MKNYFLILSMGLVFLISCSGAPQEVLLDSFEGQIDSKTVDFGAAEGSWLQVSAEKEMKFCGGQSLKLDYDLKPSGYMWAARGYKLDVAGAAQWELKPQEINWKKYQAISLAMYGQGQGAVVAFDLKDNGGEVWRFLLDDDFNGWKENICPFKEFFPRKDWQPESAVKNDSLDFPIMSFQFEPRLPGQGAYYFDCVKVIKHR